MLLGNSADVSTHDEVIGKSLRQNHTSCISYKTKENGFQRLGCEMIWMSWAPETELGQWVICILSRLLILARYQFCDLKKVDCTTRRGSWLSFPVCLTQTPPNSAPSSSQISTLVVQRCLLTCQVCFILQWGWLVAVQKMSALSLVTGVHVCVPSRELLEQEYPELLNENRHFGKTVDLRVSRLY